MTETGSFRVQPSPDSPVVTVLLEGYCNQQTMQSLQQALEPFLQAQKNRIVIDFSQCNIINSPGISALLELLLAVREDYFGKAVFTGLSPLLKEVFSFAGIDSLVEQSGTLAEAQNLAAR